MASLPTTRTRDKVTSKVNNEPFKAREAQEYENFIDTVQNQLPEDLNILNGQLLEGSKVLDLGCGTGNYTYMLAERVGSTGRVIGVDPDRERIKIAREKWVRDNLTFMDGDGESFPEAQYDLIFSYYAIHWIKNKQLVFEKAYNNLRHRGQFAFVGCYGISTIGEEMSTLMGPEGHQAINSLWHLVPVEKYKELATNVGFTVTLIEEDFDKYTFPNVDVLLSSWHGITTSKFDASKADQVGLQNFKRKYFEKQPVLESPVIRAILTKP